MMGRLILHHQLLCVLFLLVYVHLQVVCSSSFSSSSINSTLLCNPKQSHALLRFKKITSFDCYVSSYYCDIYHTKTESWMENIDCCSWDGITCDELMGNVIGLDLSCSCLKGTINHNSSLFHLSHLHWLNLAYNDFSGSLLSFEFGQFGELRVLNLSNSGFFGLVPSEISQLSKLVLLDLSCDADYCLTFEQKDFVLLARNLTGLIVLNLNKVSMTFVEPVSLLNLSSSIRVLRLSDSGIEGEMPVEIFRFPNLQEIYLDGNELTGYLPKSNWTSPLRLLDLSSSNFIGEIPESIGNLKFLEDIRIQYCSFTGSIPASIGNLTRLTKLNFSSNSFSGQVPSSLSKLERLTYLDLSRNKLAGQIPDIFGNLSKLTTLFLSGNNFSGQIPPSLFNHMQLAELSISFNHLTGPLPYHVSGLSNLSSLGLSHNFLNGKIPPWLFTLPSLFSIALENNQLTGPIDQFETPNSVREIYLGNNKLNGSIPISIFELVNLTGLDLSSNNFSGTIQFDMLSRMAKLEWLDLSYNNLLSISSNSGVVNILPKLSSLLLSSCNINEFPSFLKNLKNLEWLDFSNNRIGGKILKSESKGWQSLSFLNLSHNFLIYIEQHPWEQIYTLDLQHNNLQGPLLVPPPTTVIFLLSNNKLTGEIPPSICDLSFLEGLSFSNNKLSGEIPQCLGNFNDRLSMLHLQNNNLHGSIPDSFEIECSLISLDLSGNKLEGTLPRSLANCSKLEVVNIGNNEIRDTFPHWLGTLPELKVLVLRSNRFYGHISDSKNIFPFSNLRIIDLSHNDFTSFLPRILLENLEAMMNISEEEKSGIHFMGEGYYQDYVNVTMKGQKIEMERILTIFTSIDMSSNFFQGEIPEVLGNLKSLLVLNLAHNNLTGKIPLSLGNMKSLEFLDLSSNKLNGTIPMQLESLTFLSELNLSYNHLSGHIPEGNQFYTYGSDSFIGNIGLCGMQLSVNCSNDGASQLRPSVAHEEDDTQSEYDWKIMMMGYGCGLVIGLSIGYIVFSIY